MNLLEMYVREFHQKFDRPMRDRPLRGPVPAAQDYRHTLMREEFREMLEEMDSSSPGDCANLAKEAADLIYVAVGTLIEIGWPVNETVQEVHRSNMTKVWPDGSVRYRDDGKVLKPPTYRRANMVDLGERLAA